VTAWLALETATPHATIALVDDGRAIAGRTLEHTRQHAEALAEAIDDARAEVGLAWSELDGVAVGVGPGSFVGVRVAMAHAKGLCSALGIPLLGLGSLVTLACDGDDGDGWAMIDARRGEVYARAVHREGGRAVPTSDALVLSPQAAIERLAKADFLVGNAGTLMGEVPCPSLLRQGPTLEGVALAVAARLGESWHDERRKLVPAYGRAPDAKLPASA
jgi:tRNA threonylcarbamoyladenosine biosynthesis protein TsaB